MAFNPTNSEKLMHTTVRIECDLGEGRVSTGTGFFFTFKLDDTTTIPVVVTNKHVITGAKFGSFVLNLRASDGSPVIGKHQTIRLPNFESLWIQHPEKDVDLAVFPLIPLLHEAESKGLDLFYLPLQDSCVPNADAVENLGCIEDITMIGYPNGIWDMKNNMPIVRKGITATNPKLDYNGLPIVVIDCACFPGSSGSPVLIFNRGGYSDDRGNFISGSRLMLLGVLFAGPQHTAQGEVKTIDVPLQQMSIILSHIPNNLGFIVKAQKILDFLPILKK